MRPCKRCLAMPTRCSVLSPKVAIRKRDQSYLSLLVLEGLSWPRYVPGYMDGGQQLTSQAINRAAQEGSPYRHILLSTVGIVFLATPFHGSDAAKQARWHVLVAGIMGEQASEQLIQDLEQRHDFVRQRVQKFTEIANAEAVRLPLSCFFETRKTEMLRCILSRGWAKKLSTVVTHKIVR